MRLLSFSQWLKQTQADISLISHCPYCYGGRGYKFELDEAGAVTTVNPCDLCAKTGALRLLKKQYRASVKQDRRLLESQTKDSTGKIIL